MGRALRDGSVTSVQLTQAAFDRIALGDSAIHAFVHLDAQAALAGARSADASFASGVDRGPLQGIPYALKDIYDAAGMPTGCQSRLRSDHVAKRDSAVAARFRAAGAVLLGKLDTFEFALGGPSEDLPKPMARNPWNIGHAAGGSSSGSGAAVAAGFVPVATGTCTAGSIRGPAAWCGVVGMKPTFGRVSRRGVYALAPSLDHCGPLARSVRDAAHALAVMAGHDPEDPSSVDVPVADYAAGLEDGVEGLRIGVPYDFFASDPSLTDDARQGIARAEELLRKAGAQVQRVSLPDYKTFLACGRVLLAAESFAVHRDDLAVRLSDYGVVAARRFAIGATVSAADYIATLELKRRLTAAMDEALGECDLILTAVSLTTAPRLDMSTRPTAWPLQSTPFNVTGHPAASVPVGLGADGLPLAVQIAGRRWDEAVVLRACRVIERDSGWAAKPLPGLPGQERPSDT
ncbi:MAG: amidase [Rhizobiaceae bacterium]|nr:amidase [Rhizobiaceae bacterium]